MGTVVLGTGSCLPERIVANVEFESIVDTSDEWIQTRTGIVNRRVSGRNENTYQLAAEAAKRALGAAGISAEEIGLLVVGTISSHMQMPSTACFVQQEIGAFNAFAYDLNAACSGFLYGMDLADRYIRSDSSMKVLVIGAEVLSGRVDYTDRNTCILFGDGAGAVVFGHSDNENGIMGTHMLSDGRLWKLLYMHGPESSNPALAEKDWKGAYIQMEGREVFKHAVNSMSDSVMTLLERKGVQSDDIDLVIPHQANIRIINKLTERLGVDESRVFVNVANYGNTSAASVPIALDEAVREGRVREGDMILLAAFGGGFTWGSALIRW